jgi:hypothetical protein
MELCVSNESYDKQRLCAQLTFAEANNRVATQEYSNILWSPKVYCRVHQALRISLS